MLVHGAWHGAWCWYKVVPQLAQAGHKVIAPDLPGLGATAADRGDLARSMGRAHLCHRRCRVEPVVLVGHSRGGIVIEVAERRPSRVAKLVYLTAFLLRDGQTVLGVADTATASLVVPNIVASDDQVFMTVREDAVREAFYASVRPRTSRSPDAAATRADGSMRNSRARDRHAVWPRAEGRGMSARQCDSDRAAAGDGGQQRMSDRRVAGHRPLAVFSRAEQLVATLRTIADDTGASR